MSSVSTWQEGRVFWQALADYKDRILPGLTAHFSGQNIEGAKVLARGRTDTWSLPFESGHMVVRHLTHGGALASFTGDLFFGNLRPFLEFELSTKARAAGVNTPPVLAARVEKLPLGLYKGDVITLEVPKATDGRTVIESEAFAEKKFRLDYFESIGQAVAQLHNAGVVHADLNMMNLLVDEQQSIHIIDLDKGYAVASILDSHRKNNLSRLARSIRKCDTQNRVTTDEFAVLLTGYAPDNPGLIESLMSCLDP